LQIVVAVNMTPQEYAKNCESTEWPVIEKCPICGARTNLHSHGSYMRNALPSRDVELMVKIRRLLCPICRKTVSLLPSFLLSRFQYTARFIVKSLCKKVKSYSQLIRFHWKRFLENLSAIQAFFREMGFGKAFPEEEKEKAIKLLALIENSGVEEFSMVFHKHYRRSFMAH